MSRRTAMMMCKMRMAMSMCQRQPVRSVRSVIL